MSPRLSQDQLTERARGLGASDVAAAAGLSPWQSPFELYLEKIGELDREAQLDEATIGRMERGHRFEALALEWDRDSNGGEPYERVNRTIWHPQLPFMYCHPDARRKPWRTTRTLIEVKTAARPWKEVPRHVEVQVMAQMACTGATSVEIVVLTFDGPPQRLVVPRDEELVVALENLAAQFWARVERRDPPPMDGSQGASRWLDRTRWRDEPELEADAAQVAALDRLLTLRRQLAALETEEAGIVNALKFSMAGSSRLRARGIGQVVWTVPTERRSTRWKDVAQELSVWTEPDTWADIVTRHTTVEDGVRSFRVTPEGSTK